MSPLKINISFILFWFALIPFLGYAQVAEDGKVDLSTIDFSQGKSVPLKGRWEFYWNKLLTPSDFQTNQYPAYIQVPGSWHRQGYPTLGCATYRLTIQLSPHHKSVAIYFPVINSAAKIWVNGGLSVTAGLVSLDSKRYQPKLSATTLIIPDHINTVELIVQVANYTYFSSGISNTPQLQRADSLFLDLNRANGVENFFAGSLIAMFFYQVVLYFLYHRGKPYLWLSLICLGVALRALIVHGGSFLLPNLFPSVSWEIWKKIEFGSVYAIISLFPLYVYHLFADHAPKKPILFFVGVSSVLVSVVLFTPQYFYGRLLDVAHLGLLLGFIYAVYSISKAWRSGNEDAKVILLGVLASFPFILTEILKNSILFSLNLNFMYLVEMGVLVFLLFQVYLLSNHYAKAYHNLEKIVDERTNQLVTANAVKDRLLSVMSHDIKSPLNSLRGVLHMVNVGAVSQDEFSVLARQIEGDLSKTNMLVENILYWTTSQLKGVQVKIEKFDLLKLVEENLELFKTSAELKKIVLVHHIPTLSNITSDRNIINLALRNLIANAIKFTFEGGRITISYEKSDAGWLIHVNDSGIGISSEALQNIFVNQSLSTSGTSNEKGTGLGLALCREYLQKIGGELIVESLESKGSTFTIQLPFR